MSHGKRMLEAQAQKARTSGTRDTDGRVDDGHLRSAQRAFNDDGTPVRPTFSNGHPTGEDEAMLLIRNDVDDHRGSVLQESTSNKGGRPNPLLTSPLPRPSVQLSRDEGSSQRRGSERQGSARGRVPVSQTQTDQGRDASAAAALEPKSGFNSAVKQRGKNDNHRQQGQRAAARPIDVDGGSSSDGEKIHEKQSKTCDRGGQQNRTRTRSSTSSGPPSYPADGVRLQGSTTNTPTAAAAAAPSTPPLLLPSTTLHLDADAPSSSFSTSATPGKEGLLQGPQQSRSSSRSPPPVTLTEASSSGLRTGPLLTPVTAALQPPSKSQPANRSASGRLEVVPDSVLSPGTDGQRPPSLIQLVPSTPAVQSLLKPPLSFSTESATSSAGPSPTTLLMFPASPPLRAGVSPRMLARHPTRFDTMGGGSTSTTASLAASQAVSAGDTLPPPPNPPQAQQQSHLTPVTSPSSAEWQQMNYRDRSTKFSSEGKNPGQVLHSGLSAGFAGQPNSEDAVMPAVDGDDGWHSVPPSPLPPSQPAEYAVPQLSPPSMAAAAKVEDVSQSFPPAITTISTTTTLSAPPLPQPSVPINVYPCSSLRESSFDCVHCPHLRDYSGFHNSGNDCYGCSALSMLLRSTVFRRALLMSPLVAAVRRYESLVTRRPERRVLWTSGYVETPPPSPLVKKAIKRERDVGAKEGGEGKEVGQEESVAESSGLSAGDAVKSEGQQSETKTKAVPLHAENAFLTRAVQQTLGFVETLTLVELEEVLKVDPVTWRVPVTLHTALAALARSVRWRERLTAQINYLTTRPAERQRLLEDKVYHENDRDFDGQVYMQGIRLRAVASLFQGEFFLGEQEDAHELFVALMAKLEAEAVDFQRSCAEVWEGRQREALRYGKGEEGEKDEEDEEREKHDDTLRTRPSTAVEGFTSSLHVTKIPPPPLISTAMADAWVNSLIQTRLLNIIRCRSPGCYHEIVTDEICVNLSLHIPEEEEEKVEGDNESVEHEAATGGRLPSKSPVSSNSETDEEEQQDDGNNNFPCFDCLEFPTRPSMSAQAPSAAAAATHTASPCSVAALLHNSMAFEPLCDYKCDGCGFTSLQYQGGCFYTRPPPVLVLQLKRFSTEFVKGTLRITKNSRPVAVEDMLVIYALPSTEELRQQQQQQKGAPSRPLRTVTLSEMEAEMHRRSWKRNKACEQKFVVPPHTTATTATATMQEQSFFYNAVDKCFTCVTRAQEGVAAGAMGTDAGTNLEPTSPATSAAVLVTAIRCVYRLQSCVLHLGDSLHFGHYVADFAVDGEDASTADLSHRRTDDDGPPKQASNEENHDSEVSANLGASSSTPRQWRRWRRVNDAHVEVLGEAIVRSRRAGRSDVYLLLYERGEEEWVRCPVDAVLPKPVYPVEKRKQNKVSS